MSTNKPSSSSSRPVENVWDYPRPPALEKTDRLLEVTYVHPDGTQTPLASTREGYRVLETSHPPTYYLPPDALHEGVKLDVMKGKQSYCEWKGTAAYHTLSIPTPTPSSSSSPPISISSRIWSYPSPTSSFKPIKDYLSFYASSSTSSSGGWKCFVDGEEVIPQEGDFYGGWKTSDVTGGERGMKGGRGTWGW